MKLLIQLFLSLGVVLFLLSCDWNTDDTLQDRPMTPQRDIDSVLNDHAPKLMEIPGVVGVYRSETKEGKPCIKIMAEKKTAEFKRSVPKVLEGYPVLIEESGIIRPLK